MTWIFVCSNNLVRSVVAAAICRQLAPEIQVDSAGLAESCKDRLNRQGLVGKRRPIAPLTRKYLKENGCVGTEGRRPRQLTADDVKKTDLIWVMTEDRKRTDLKRFPEAAGKERLLEASRIKAPE